MGCRLLSFEAETAVSGILLETALPSAKTVVRQRGSKHRMGSAGPQHQLPFQRGKQKWGGRTDMFGAKN